MNSGALDALTMREREARRKAFDEAIAIIESMLSGRSASDHALRMAIAEIRKRQPNAASDAP